ncbi:MAG: hypothetical protein KDD64_04815 [Bdellovibrionales bacterium]|nr:hypothetical protein [Bdellovibrionales bacterium]
MRTKQREVDLGAVVGIERRPEATPQESIDFARIARESARRVLEDHEQIRSLAEQTLTIGSLLHPELVHEIESLVNQLKATDRSGWLELVSEDPERLNLLQGEIVHSLLQYQAALQQLLIDELRNSQDAEDPKALMPLVEEIALAKKREQEWRALSHQPPAQSENFPIEFDPAALREKLLRSSVCPENIFEDVSTLGASLRSLTLQLFGREGQSESQELVRKLSGPLREVLEALGEFRERHGRQVDAVLKHEQAEYEERLISGSPLTGKALEDQVGMLDAVRLCRELLRRAEKL